MKEYFFLNGTEQHGPLNIEELIEKRLSNEIFIWTEGMENWQKLKDLPELVKIMQPKPTPPPPPTDSEKIIKAEIIGQVYTTTKGATGQIKIPKWFAYWSIFHLVALFLSFSGLKYFNHSTCLGGTSWETDEFWPFSGILTFLSEDPGEFPWCGYTTEKYFGNYVGFNGFFYNYDLTEFAFYIGAALLILLLIRLSNKSEKAD